ncbi:KH domain-containing protein akap-1 isoform X2 [Linepithema humile]
MDIPVKNPTSQSFCTDSGQARCMNIEPVQQDVQLGSNPNASYFEIVANSRKTLSSESNSTIDKMTRIFEDIVDIGDKKEQTCEIKPFEQKYMTELNNEENRQRDEKHAEDTIKTQGQAAEERDSANHSPISGVLEGSVTDEARSEGSTDSGKGGSINGYRKDNTVQTTYDFAIPHHLVGRLIGRHGNFLQSIRTKAEVDIYVNDHPCDGDHKICSIQGSVEGVNVALKMIRQKFPEKKFPQVTLAEISTLSDVNEEIPTLNIPLIMSTLPLIDGVSNDINISHIVKPNWLFVQLPTHPTHPYLQNLEEEMTCWYNSVCTDPVVDVMSKGTYVAVYWNNKWVRGCIENPDPLGQNNIVRLLDYGGYWQLSNVLFKPIKFEYLHLPFQAIEVFLANIQPKEGEWSKEAYNLVHSAGTCGIAQALIEGRIDNNVYANIYFNVQNYGVISLGEELVANGYAKHVTWEHMKPETMESIYPST